jgi:hypothetical protein
MKESTTGKGSTLSTPRTLKPVFESLCSLAVFLIGCGNDSHRGNPAPGVTWIGSESCTANLLIAAADGGAELYTTLPSTIVAANAAVTRTVDSVTLSGVDLGPVADWSCSNQTLVATCDPPTESSVLNRFSLPVTMCTTPTIDG